VFFFFHFFCYEFALMAGWSEKSSSTSSHSNARSRASQEKQTSKYLCCFSGGGENV
jgi:hypothetical protein